ncbi:MAG: tetratricopeptide repeat protein [Nitrospiraceae bacterium]
MSLRFPITVVLSIVCLAVPAWADYKAGEDAYNRGDFATALREWRPLAEQGNPEAQVNLGQLYLKGHGVPQDYIQARQWFEKAAVQGRTEAQTGLGDLYLTDHGGRQDYQQALFWFRVAASHGNALAQTKLGLMYERGNGVTQDVVLALRWYILGAANGDELGTEHRDALSKHMTPAQIFQARQQAREWKPPQK